MKNHLKILSLCSGLLLASCGGSGGSDSGGGAGPNDGTYTGTANTTFAFTSIGSSDTQAVPITFVFSGSTVTAKDGPASGTATLNGSNYSVSIKENDTDPATGITCNLTIVFTGSVGGNKTSGKVGGSGTCSYLGQNFPVKMSGNYSASKSGSARASTQTISHAMGQAILKQQP